MLIELIGIAGGVLLLGAFLEVSLGRWDGKNFLYELSNLIGCILLFIYALHKQAYTNLVLNVIWGAVALFVIINILNRHKIRRTKR